MLVDQEISKGKILEVRVVIESVTKLDYVSESWRARR